jgi:hypothetical protein
VTNFFFSLSFAAYQKNILKKLVILFGYCPKYISSIKKFFQKDVYWSLPQKTKQGKLDQINLELAQI